MEGKGKEEKEEEKDWGEDEEEEKEKDWGEDEDEEKEKIVEPC